MRCICHNGPVRNQFPQEYVWRINFGFFDEMPDLMYILRPRGELSPNPVYYTDLIERPSVLARQEGVHVLYILNYLNDYGAL